MNNGNDLSLIFGIVGVAGATYCYSKLKKIASKVDMTVEELSSKAIFDIERSIIDRAIQKAVDREIEKAASYALKTASESLSAQIRSQVKQAVDSSRSEIKRAMSDEVVRRVSALDVAALKKDVISSAKAAVAEKLDGCLEESLSGFNQNLENISKIYGSIAKSMSKETEGGMVLRIV